MKRFGFAVMWILLGWVLGVAGPAMSEELPGRPFGLAHASSPAFRSGEILVRFQPDIGLNERARVRTTEKATFLRRMRMMPDVEVWSVPEGSEKEATRRLDSDPAVVYAEPNSILHAFATPNDPNLNKQWYHSVIGSAAAWDVTTGTQRVVIAVIDSGIDETHPDLAGILVAGYDMVGDDADPHDENGHGTHVAGIVGAQGNNAVGVAGMAWNAAIMPVRVTCLGRQVPAPEIQTLPHNRKSTILQLPHFGLG